MSKIEFATANLTAGQLNSLVKKIMFQMGISDPVEAIRRINSDEWTLVGPAESTAFDLVDCNVAPFVPEGWTVVENRQCGKVRPDDADLYMSEKQKNGPVSGNEFQKKLADLPVLNAAMLDWYLAHPERIPETWKGKLVFFWGTIYRDANGYLFVRVLDWNGDQWNWDGYCLGYDFSSSDPAAVASL